MSVMSEIEAIRVRIVGDDTPKPAPPRPMRIALAARKTYLASASQPETILPRTEFRRQAIISVIGVVATNSNILLTSSLADALTAIRSASYGQSMAGTILQPGMQVRINHQDETWLITVGTGTAPLVSVEAEVERPA